MDRDAARRVVFALLAVAALAAAAATIDSTVTGGGGWGGGFGGSPNDADGAPAPLFEPATGEGFVDVEPICVPTLARPPVVAGLFALLLVGHYAVYRRTDSLLSVGTAAVAVGFPVVLLWSILVACRLDFRFDGFGSADADGFSLPAGGGGFGFGDGGGTAATPTALFGVLLLAALAVALALLFVSTGDRTVDDDDATDESTADEAGDVRGVGRAAGDAADRIESDADVGNEVYRAWAEMTAHLDVERPESSTPGEFAAAAVDAGMEREDVDELTRLFEEVRYGDERVTESRAERAVAALRRIESAYAGEEP